MDGSQLEEITDARKRSGSQRARKNYDVFIVDLTVHAENGNKRNPAHPEESLSRNSPEMVHRQHLITYDTLVDLKPHAATGSVRSIATETLGVAAVFPHFSEECPSDHMRVRGSISRTTETTSDRKTALLNRGKDTLQKDSTYQGLYSGIGGRYPLESCIQSIETKHECNKSPGHSKLFAIETPWMQHKTRPKGPLHTHNM
jgi:hypothetical protein